MPYDKQGNWVDQETSSWDLTSFHEGATVTGDGAEFVVNGYKTLTIGITGTSTSRTVLFKGKDAAGNVVAMTGYKLPNYAEGSQSSGNNETWQFDLEPFVSVYFRVDAVNGGDVTIKGKAVG
jgi:hypothetical protein